MATRRLTPIAQVIAMVITCVLSELNIQAAYGLQKDSSKEVAKLQCQSKDPRVPPSESSGLVLQKAKAAVGEGGGNPLQ